MAKKEVTEDSLFEEYQDYYSQNDFSNALEKLQALFEMTRAKAFVSSLIVDVYAQMGTQDEAYEFARKGVQYPNPPSKLYKQYAELIVPRANTSEELGVALTAIETAIQLYNNDSASENIVDRFSDADTFKFWFDDKTRTRTDMASLRSDIKSLIYALSNVQNIESNISQEKQKTVELMALFTAIIALIFSNVQVLSQKRSVDEIIIVNISLIFSLTWIIWLVRRLSRNESFLPFSHVKPGRIVGIVIATLAAALMIGLLTAGNLYVYYWLIQVIK